MTDFTGAREIVLDQTLQSGSRVERGQEQMMETVVSQVCEMFVQDFVGYEVGSYHFYLGGKNQEWLLGRSDW